MSCSIVQKTTCRTIVLLGLFWIMATTTSCFWEETQDDPEFLMMDDSEYPYADIPRVAIETKDFAQLRDNVTEIPARLQIYDADEPITEVLELTVRGRGNSSFKMPKYGMKLEFSNKEEILGMPRNKDWALIANYGDKTHVRNWMALRLSEWLGMDYTPQARFVELYLNRKFMGLYLLTETIKVGKNRVNIPKNDSTFLFEKEDSKKVDNPFVTTTREHMFHIKYPKNPSEDTQQLLLDHLNDFEYNLYGRSFSKKNPLTTWLDIDDFLPHYWIQEFSKNEDGRFSRSIYLTWEKGGPIHFGPIWDMDLAFGNASADENKPAEDWYIRNYSWNYLILENNAVMTAAQEYWQANSHFFKDLIDSIPLYVTPIRKAIRNEYKRWPILKNTENWALKDPYDSYEEAVGAMKSWMEKRYQWINDNL